MRYTKYPILFLLLLLGSCSFQKRIYRNGFYISHKAHQQKTSSEKLSAEKKYIIQPENSGSSPAQKPAVLIASAKKGIINIEPAEDLTSKCDTIYFRNGTRSVAQVLEVNQKEVKYKLCNSSESPLFIFELSRIDSITFSNGSTETYLHVRPNPTVNIRSQKNNISSADLRIQRLSKTSSILGYIALVGLLCFGVGIIFALPAILVGKKAMALMKGREQEFPLEYKKAKNARLMGSIALWLALAVLTTIIIRFLLIYSLISLLDLI